ncbi:HesA/MoeB/ThiF family protein [Chenggangzhangella methanolivorans]
MTVAPSGAEGLLVNDVEVAPPEAYIVQSPVRLELAPAFHVPLLKRARDEGLGLIFAHTHPGARVVEFSKVDDAGEAVVMPALFSRAPHGPHGSLILSEHGHAARARLRDGATIVIPEIVEVGRSVRRSGPALDRATIDAIDDRNVRALGEAGQRSLRALTLAVVGAGGTGSLVIEQAAHLGIGRLILIDDERIEDTNRNRVVGASPGSVGDLKVDVAAEMVRRITGGRTIVEPFPLNVLDAEGGKLLLRADFVMCCTDSHGSRAVVNQIAYQHLVPAIDLGVQVDAVDGQVQAIAGRVQMLAPGLPCLQCGGVLDPAAVRRDFESAQERAADPYNVPDTPQPAVIALNGVVASSAMTMLMAAVAGLPMRSRGLNYNGREGVIRSFGGEPDESCVVCSRGLGAFAAGDRQPMVWRRR